MHIGQHFAVMLRKFMKKFCKLTEIKHEHRQIAQQTLSILATLPPAIQKMHEKRDLNSALLTLKLVERCVMKAEGLTDSKEKFDDPPAENLHGLLSDLKPLIISLKKCEKDMSQPKSEEIAWKAAQEADLASEEAARVAAEARRRKAHFRMWLDNTEKQFYHLNDQIEDFVEKQWEKEKERMGA